MEVAGSALIASFNDCITRKDIEGLSHLMTDDHAFIDAANNEISGKEPCLAAWTEFFVAFPDYLNIFEHVSLSGNEAAIMGHSVCSDSRLAGPALWSARLEATRIALWRFFEDTPENRAILNL